MEGEGAPAGPAGPPDNITGVTGGISTGLKTMVYSRLTTGDTSVRISTTGNTSVMANGGGEGEEEGQPGTYAAPRTAVAPKQTNPVAPKQTNPVAPGKCVSPSKGVRKGEDGCTENRKLSRNIIDGNQIYASCQTLQTLYQKRKYFQYVTYKNKTSIIKSLEWLDNPIIDCREILSTLMSSTNFLVCFNFVKDPCIHDTYYELNVLYPQKKDCGPSESIPDLLKQTIANAFIIVHVDPERKMEYIEDEGKNLKLFYQDTCKIINGTHFYVTHMGKTGKEVQQHHITRIDTEVAHTTTFEDLKYINVSDYTVFKSSVRLLSSSRVKLNILTTPCYY